MIEELPAGRVDVWFGEIDRPDCSAADRGTRIEQTERRRLLAYSRLAEVLERYLPEGAKTISQQPGGKPAFDLGGPHGWLRFNLSHSGRLAVVAVARQREVGVDVQEIGPRRRVEPVAEQYFASRERELLAGTAPDDRPAAFARLWTRKEAIAKATGTGIDEDALQIDVLDGSPGGWTLVDLEAPVGYAAALAIEGAAPEVRVGELEGTTFPLFA